MGRLFFSLLTFSLIFLLNCAPEESLLTFAVGGAPSEIDYWEKIIKEFEDQAHFKVKVLRQPTDTDQRRQSLVMALKAKKSDPDVFLMDIVWVVQFAASGWLLPLDLFMERDRFDTGRLFRSVIQEIDTYRGEIVSLPVYVDCGLLYFRKDLLEKYHCPIPQTWEELQKCAQVVQDQERKRNPQFYGFVWQGAQYEGLVCNFMEFIASGGGSIQDQDGKVRVDRKENIQALQFMRDLIYKYRISPLHTFTEMKEEEVRTFYENGNALFERNWPYAWKLHERETSPVRGKSGIDLLPRFKGGRNATALGGWHIGISRYSDQKEKAWELAKFILSQGVQKGLALNLSWNPGRKDTYDDPEVERKVPNLRIVKKAFEYAVPRPNLPYYTQISEVLQIYVNAAISGKMEPAEALKRAQGEIERIVEVYHE